MTLGALILAITVHEFSHVAMARFLGDKTGEQLGRLTLDPFKHIDPIWTVALPAILIVASASTGAGVPIFAAGKPSPYNPNYLKRRFFGKELATRTAECWVALAGPLSNLLFASLCLLGVKYGGYEWAGLFQPFILLNISLFVFNLIPVPPLDGAKVLLAFLPHEAARKYELLAPQLSWFLLIALIFGGGTVVGYGVRMVLWGISWLLI
ncbi:MAG: site-2 protease family protein [Myxococcaceae bacterium]|nr:site-2 protease family protein [Myxococcaceae bacterium]